MERRLFDGGPKGFVSTTSEPTLGSHAFDEEGFRLRPAVTELDGSLVGRTVVPGPGRNHIREFDDHCAFDGIALELVKRTVDGERLQWMVLRRQGSSRAILGQ